VEFEFFLAEKLGKMVDEIRSMQHIDWVRWTIYYGRKAQRQEMADLKAR
jgi:hypothetical protein